MMPFLGFSDGPGGSITAKPGQERIPENFYKRPDIWTTAQMFAELAIMIQRHPGLASLGGNMGKNNSFAAVDPGDLTV